MPPALSIVIPAFNEAHRLPPGMTRIAEFCRAEAPRSEVIIVVEKSADGTLELAREFAAKQANFRVLGGEVQRGKGFAVRTGMLAATGDFVFFMDADLSVPLDEITAFLRYFEKHPEIAVLAGNRQHAGSEIIQRQSWLRQKMGQSFNRIVRRLAGLRLLDTQCGFKAFRREAAHEIFKRQQLDGFAFDVEVLLLAQRLGYSIADLPVRWINSPESKVHIVRDSIRMLLDALRLRRMIDREVPAQDAARL